MYPVHESHSYSHIDAGEHSQSHHSYADDDSCKRRELNSYPYRAYTALFRSILSYMALTDQIITFWHDIHRLYSAHASGDFSTT